MNELLLIDMLSELNPELLQDDYIEKDMKKEKIPFLKLIFPFKKMSKQPYESPVENPLSEESASKYIEYNDKSQVAEAIISFELPQETEELKDENNNKRGFSISIFEKKFFHILKIISGIAATVIVVIGIIIIILKHHKSGFKLHSKKIQIIY